MASWVDLLRIAVGSNAMPECGELRGRRIKSSGGGAVGYRLCCCGLIDSFSAWRIGAGRLPVADVVAPGGVTYGGNSHMWMPGGSLGKSPPMIVSVVPPFGCVRSSGIVLDENVDVDGDGDEIGRAHV